MMTEKELYNLIIRGIKLPTTREPDPSVVNVSAVYNTCSRGFILGYRNNFLLHKLDEKLPDNMLMTFRIGNKIEEIINEALKKYSIDNSVMELEAGDFKIKGHTDNMIEINNKRYIIEIKSIKTDEFKKLNKEPIYRHEYQLMFYLYLAKKKRLGVDCGFIVYVAKEDTVPPVKIFKVKLTNRFKKEMDKLILDLKSGQLPERVCLTKNHAKMIKCPILEYCFKEV